MKLRMRFIIGFVSLSIAGIFLFQGYWLWNNYHIESRQTQERASLLLEQAIADFSQREQDVIRMRFVDGLTQVEIADRLGVSQVQVSRLLRRTLRRLQDKIDPDGLMHG